MNFFEFLVCISAVLGACYIFCLIYEKRVSTKTKGPIDRGVVIESVHNGFTVTYYDRDIESPYVFKATEDLIMLEHVAKKFLERRVKIKQNESTRLDGDE